MKRISQVVLLLLLSTNLNGLTKSETFPVGSYIINMGMPEQTVGNGMKPYGLVYELLKTYKVPVKWVIGAGKTKDGIDFSYASTDYRGGTFIIPKTYISPLIASRIHHWEGKGVVGIYTHSLLTLSVTETLTSVPNWTLNNGNISIAKGFFTSAGIPSSAYNQTDPANLGACNDIFVLPHATPTWAVHGNLYKWNRTQKGAIWSGCHAVSGLENLVNPSDTSQKLNFLTTGGLIDYNAHAHATPTYNYFFNRTNHDGSLITAKADDPVFQMMGIEDAAHANGSEQVYIPKTGSSWRNITRIGCYDSIQANVSATSGNGPAALTLYGRGFGLNSSGLVMYQSGHDIDGTGSANIAAMRQFFNFSFAAMKDKVPVITSSSIPATIEEDYPNEVSVTALSPIGAVVSYQWSSTCAGTFGNPAAASTTFTPTGVDSNRVYTISCVVSDQCSRYTFHTVSSVGAIKLPVTLIGFNARLNISDAMLTWFTATEENVNRFDVYRSFNGRNYNLIGNIIATGKSTELNNYSFTDKQITDYKQKNISYRLKIIDNDNKFKWSDISRLKIEESNFRLQVSVFPNPTSNLINIVFTHIPESDLTISIVDVYGRTIHLFTNQELNWENGLVFDVKNLENGLYYVNILNADKSTTSVKFLKL